MLIASSLPEEIFNSEDKIEYLINECNGPSR